MTKKELSQLYFLRKEICTKQKQIEKLEALATSCTSKFSDMPHSTEKSDKIGKIGTKIADLKNKLEKNLQNRVKIESEISDFIENVEDVIVRMILIHRCINCYSWGKIANKIGGNNTSDGLRKIYERFLRENFK